MSQVKQFNFTQEQIDKLCKMQDELNTYIHPEWKTQGFNWNLAIIDECMEIHGHLGWKWWKKDYKVGLTAEANKKQVQLEVIDILHFVLSSYKELYYVDTSLLGIFNRESDLSRSLESIVDVLIESASSGDLFNIFHVWAHIAATVGLTEQEILETYTQKYVLNKFRQDHGYKTGEYVKLWAYEICNSQYPDLDKVVEYEDNQMLESIVANLKAGRHNTTDETLLYNELSLAYNSRLNK